MPGCRKALAPFFGSRVSCGTLVLSASRCRAGQHRSFALPVGDDKLAAGCRRPLAVVLLGSLCDCVALLGVLPVLYPPSRSPRCWLRKQRRRQVDGASVRALGSGTFPDQRDACGSFLAVGVSGSTGRSRSLSASRSPLRYCRGDRVGFPDQRDSTSVFPVGFPDQRDSS